MSRVRHSGTDPELKLRSALHRVGFRFLLKSGSKLPGRPDIVLTRYKVAVFVDGCFWHGCPTHGSRSKTNVAFWDEKIQRNKSRDQAVDQKLAALGWTAIRVWEHQTKSVELPATIAMIIQLVGRKQ